MRNQGWKRVGKRLARGAFVCSSLLLLSACGEGGDILPCEHGERRSDACGGDRFGFQSKTCVDGVWYPINSCRLLDGSVHPDDTWGSEDDCKNGAQRAARCGEDNQGLQPEECRDGSWEPMDLCSYGQSDDA